MIYYNNLNRYLSKNFDINFMYSMHNNLFPVILETLNSIVVRKTDSSIIILYIEFLMKLKLYILALDLIKEYTRDSRFLNNYELYYYQGLMILLILIEDVESLLNKSIPFSFLNYCSAMNNNYNLNNTSNFTVNSNYFNNTNNILNSKIQNIVRYNLQPEKDALILINQQIKQILSSFEMCINLCKKSLNTKSLSNYVNIQLHISIIIQKILYILINAHLFKEFKYFIENEKIKSMLPKHMFFNFIELLNISESLNNHMIINGI